MHQCRTVSDSLSGHEDKFWCLITGCPRYRIVIYCIHGGHNEDASSASVVCVVLLYVNHSGPGQYVWEYCGSCYTTPWHRCSEDEKGVSQWYVFHRYFFTWQSLNCIILYLWVSLSELYIYLEWELASKQWSQRWRKLTSSADTKSVVFAVNTKI